MIVHNKKNLSQKEDLENKDTNHRKIKNLFQINNKKNFNTKIWSLKTSNKNFRDSILKMMKI
jgi:hypothetical protein